MIRCTSAPCTTAMRTPFLQIGCFLVLEAHAVLAASPGWSIH